MSTELSVTVNGTQFKGWTEARVSRTIDAISGTFEFSVSDKWAERRDWKIREEDEVSITIDGVQVATGYVDAARIDLGADEHSIQIRGRDPAAFLVDVSAIPTSWEYKGKDTLRFLSDLANPIRLLVDPGVTLRKPAVLSVTPGETIFQVIDGVARYSGALPVSTDNGNVKFTTPGSGGLATVAVTEGKNVLRASATYDASDRYYEVVVTGQGKGTKDTYGKAAGQIKASATDDFILRTNRRLFVSAEGKLDLKAAKARAEWEVSVRAARGQQISATVRGWRQGLLGDLWRVNTKVAVDMPSLRAKGEMLISGVSYELSPDGGQVTTLTLSPPDAYLPEPPTEDRWKL